MAMPPNMADAAQIQASWLFTQTCQANLSYVSNDMKPAFMFILTKGVTDICLIAATLLLDMAKVAVRDTVVSRWLSFCSSC